MRWFARATSVAFIVFRIVWVLFSVALWILGLVNFIGNAAVDTWFMWGGICAIPLCVQVIRQAITSARSGAERGSREYTITYYEHSAEVRDNSGSGCLWGFVGGLIGGIVVGPVVLPLYALGVGYTAVLDLIALCRSL